MRIRTRAIAFVAVGIVAATSFAVQAAQPQRALTPGSVVLLANRTSTDASDILRAALTNSDPQMRRAAARVASVAHPEVFDSLLRALEKESDPLVVAEMVKDALALGGEKVVSLVDVQAKRAGVSAVMEMAEWYARMNISQFIEHLAAWNSLPGAEQDLRRVVAMALKRHPESRKEILRAWSETASPDAARPFAEADTSKVVFDVFMRTPAGLTGELFKSTLNAAGCKPGASRAAVAQITYTADGRPREIHYGTDGLPDDCRQAIVALARISTDPGDSVKDQQLLALPISDDFIKCMLPASAVVNDTEAGEDKTSEGPSPPRLKKEVKPSYTRAALERRIAGVVEMRAVVSSTGCVANAMVIEPLEEGLNLQAILAVLQWRFEPGRFQGTPVPVRVSVEMTFTPR